MKSYKIYIWLYMIIFITFYSCTITLNNISTHGTATDVVDEEQDASPTVSPNISVPMSPL